MYCSIIHVPPILQPTINNVETFSVTSLLKKEEMNTKNGSKSNQQMGKSKKSKPTINRISTCISSYEL